MKTAQCTLSLERCPDSGLNTCFVNLCLEFCMCLYNNNKNMGIYNIWCPPKYANYLPGTFYPTFSLDKN